MELRVAYSSREARAHPRLRLLVNGLKLALIPIVAAAFFRPFDEHLPTWTLIVLPWAAIGLVARFQPFYRFGGARNDGRPDLFILLILPGAVLLWRVMHEYKTLSWAPLVVLGCAGSLILVAAARKADPWWRRRGGGVLAAALLACPYGCGAGLEINALADFTVPRIYATSVLGKHVVRDSRTTTRYLTLAPWGPVQQAQDVSVSKAHFDEFVPGATLCVFLGAGALRVPWYQFGDCPDGAPGGHPKALN